MRGYSLFLLWYPLSKKSQKRRQKINLFQFCFTLRKCFVFVICRHFTTLKQNLLKNGQSHDAKNNRSEHFVSQCTDIIHLHCRFNEGGIKLLFLINNYIWINLVSTRHLRPWYANYKMSVDDSRQKIGRNMYLQGTVMHRKMHRIEKCKMLQKSRLSQTTTFSSLCFLTYPNNFMFFSYETNIRPSNYGKIFEKCMKSREQIQMT